MIPDIEEIIRMLKAGECTEDQALQWIGTHIDLISNREALRDTFAAMAAIGRDAEGNLLRGSVVAVMGYAKPEDDPQFKDCDLNEGPGRLKALGWWATAEARIRYAKADAMMEARLL